MNKIIFSLICVSLLTVPIFFLVKNEEIFEFNKMLLTYFFVSCILTFWGIKTILDKKFTFRTTPLDRWIVLFFLSQLISTALSMHPRTSLLGYYTRFHGGLLSTVAYIILFYATTTFVQKKQLKLILGSVLTGGLFAALYAFPEHFGHSPSCVILTNQFDASCWIQDVQSRVFGTFGQPNWLAAFLILILPLAYGLMLLPTKIYKGLGAFLTVLFVSTVLFTQSRSGFLGMAVGTIIFFGLLNLSKRLGLQYWR